MKNDKNNIKVIELMPYGSFPVGVARDIYNDIAALSFRESSTERAIYWFENEENEVA